MLSGAMLGLVEQLALDIMILTDEIDEVEFFNSRMTRTKTLSLLASLVQTIANLPEESRQRMPQIDWVTWSGLKGFTEYPDLRRLQIWVAIKELVPITVNLLNTYRKIQPDLFAFSPTL